VELFDEPATRLLNRLHDELDSERRALLAARPRDGRIFDFLPPSEATEGDWRIAPVPPALQDRRVEITGPTNAKMVINALNSGARCFMADFEDSNSPTWQNMTEGQRNLHLAIRGELTHSDNGKEYALAGDPALLLCRVRGLHLPERHLDSGVCGAFMDFALYLRHNHAALADRGWGPFFYLPKLESHLEARLWNRAFEIAEEELGLERGTIRATVLIETVPAAFEMEEILYELRDHAAGLNAGRWDYLFSVIKCFRERAEFVLPDRNAVTMTVPFMHAYTERLVSVCHRRGAHAMGGMSAVIPSRTDPEANQRALEAVSADKRREAAQGYDGTWVAHPDSVAVAMREFDAVLGDRPNQLDKLRDDVAVTNKDLLAVGETPGAATLDGLANDVDVGIRYIASWLGGNGAAGIHGLMEDAATAEIARGQVWQWIRHGIRLDTGRPVTPELVRSLITESSDASELFEQVALSDDFPEFLTLPAYEKLVELHG
jgi:malate synthase